MLQCRLVFLVFSLLVYFSHPSKAQKKEIALQKVNTATGLFLVLKNNIPDPICSIVCYNLLVMPKEGDPFQIKSMGEGAVDNDLPIKLARLKVGDALYVTNVLMKCSTDSTAQSLKNRVYLLK